MRKLLQFVTLCACLLLHTSLVAQTYTFNGSVNSDWNNGSNWSPVGVPPNPLITGSIVIAADCNQNVNRSIGSGASLTVNAGVTLTRTNNSLTIQGTMTNNGTLINNRALSISNTGTLINNGTIDNGDSGNDNINNSGTIQNNGVINMLDGDLNNQGTGILNNNATGSITISNAARLINQNELNNAGSITNYGIINAATGSGDIFTNTGILINNLTITIGNGGTLVNTASGQLTNNASATLTINNQAILINDGIINNSGTVNNNNSLSNTGTFNNNSGGVLNNGNGNGDLFDNTGTLNNNVGATINNFPGSTINSINGTFVNDGTYTGAAPLPIDLLYFIGKVQENTVLLKWETASEKENAYIAVERSKDGIHFQEIGRRKGAGTTSLQQYYDFTDTTPFFGLNYYRLRQVDTDEKATYHNIIAVEFGGKAKEDIQLFPTQAYQDITIILSAPPVTNSTLQIWDTSGKLLRQQTWNAESIQETINITSLAAGTYFVTFQNGNSVQTLRFMRL